jgi:anti-sigma-K factor RskA
MNEPAILAAMQSGGSEMTTAMKRRSTWREVQDGPAVDWPAEDHRRILWTSALVAIGASALMVGTLCAAVAL